MSVQAVEPETLAIPASPYKGLVPFNEEDAPFFFGRDEWREIIIDNLRAYRLTLLYGGSGAGKSSVLRAGVVHELRQRGQRKRERVGVPGHAVAIVRSWRGDSLAELLACLDAATQGLPEPAQTEEYRARDGYGDPDDFADSERPAPVRLLSDALERCARRAGGRVHVILDQFEEYFLYHPQPEPDASFEAALAAAINDRRLPATFLIAIREDAVAQLDRFKTKIPGLFENYLRIGLLDREDAREAVEGPLEEYNRRTGGSMTVEPALVEGILDSVESGKVLVGRGGVGVIDGTGTGGRGGIEAPYLQLVLTRLWDEERLAGSDVLRFETFKRLGGAQGIVQTHLDTAMAALAPAEQDAAAKLLNYLVTPSGTKIAQRAGDLATYAEVPETEAARILERLAGELRILRPLGQGSYEIYHDALAAPILDWRARWQQRQQRWRERRRTRRWALAALLLSVVAAALVLLALDALSAKHQAQSADAKATHLGLASAAQDLLNTRPDVSLVLALAAYHRSPSRLPEVRASMIAALEQARRSGASGILHGSSDTVTSVAFSPQTATLAAASADGTVRFWNPGTRRQIGKPLRVGAAVFSVAFSPDGRTLASGAQDGTVSLWDVATHSRLGKPVRLEPGIVIALEFSRAGDELVGAGLGSGITRVAVVGRRLGQPVRLATDSSVRSVAISPDSTTLAAVGTDGKIALLDLATGQPRGGGTEISGTQLYSVSFSPRGGELAAAGNDGRVWLWNLTSAKPEAIVQAKGPPIDGIAFGPDGRTIATARADDTVQLWDAVSRSPDGAPLAGHEGIVTSVAFSRDGRTLASGSTDQTVRLWSIPVQRSFGDALPQSLRFVDAISFSPIGDQLATAGSPGIRLWDVVNGLPVGHSTDLTDSGSVRGVAFTPRGDVLASGTARGMLQRWDMATKGATTLSADPGHPLDSVAISRNGRTLAFAGQRGVTLLDLATGRSRSLQANTGRVFSVAFNRAGDVLASGGDDRTIRLWDVASGRQIGRPLEGHSDAVFSVAFGPSGRTLASGSADDTVRLWDVSTHRQIGQPLVGHHGYVWSVAFSRDGQIVASGSADGTIRFWYVASRTQIGEPLSTGAPIRSVAFSPVPIGSGGELLISGGADGTIRTWPVVVLPRHYPQLRAQVCSIVGSGLSQSEWKQYVPGLPFVDPCQNAA